MSGKCGASSAYTNGWGRGPDAMSSAMIQCRRVERYASRITATHSEDKLTPQAVSN